MENLSASGCAAAESAGLPWRPYCLNSLKAVAGNRARLLRDGAEAFPAMLESINGAKESVLLCVYAVADDGAGRRFASALAAAARRGVKVYLVYDAIGSVATPWTFFGEMEDAGARVAQYHPVLPWKPHWTWFRRNHSKLLVIDGQTAFIGGFNITSEYAPRDWGGEGWRDTGVELRGPAVREAAELFWDSWRRCGKDIPPGAAKPAAGKCGAVWASLASSVGIVRRNFIRRGYKNAILKSTRYIYITNAYFLPGGFIHRKLIKAAKRGVRVAIITAGVTNQPLVRWAAWSLLGRLLRDGVEIYEWTPCVLHAKTAVIDGQWSCAGSYNLDHLSLHYNIEVNANIYGPEFGGQMRRMFEEDLKRCRRLTLEEWKKSPLIFRLLSRAIYWFRNFM